MIKKLRVTVDGKPFEVTVEMTDEPGAVEAAPPLSAPAGAAASPSPPAPVAKTSAAPGDIPSPLAGHVVAINVKPGQEVREGDCLLTVETMKMNTFICAPRPGKVAAILVAIGDAVEEGRIVARLA